MHYPGFFIVKCLLLTVGKTKTSYLAQGLDDYAGRLGPYGGCQLAQVRPEKGGKGRDPEQLKKAEGERLLKRLENIDQVWALDVKGGELSSGQWAKALQKAREGGARRLVLVIGGAEGLAPEVLERANRRISLGPATLPHELAALVALEQLYRAHTILAGSPYHRG